MHPEPFAATFAQLAATAAPGMDAMLVAIAREFRPVDAAQVDARLDALARPLFGLASVPADEAAGTLAMTAHLAVPDTGAGVAAWLIDLVVEHGSGGSVVRAAVAAEVGRRAGVAAGVLRHRDRWLVMVEDDERRFASDVGPALDLGATDCARASAQSGRVCAHGLALEVLGGLAAAWRWAGDGPRARRASGLRLLLPVDGAMRQAIRRELRRDVG